MSKLEEAINFLREEVAPFANEMDADTNILRRAYLTMGERKLLGLRIPTEFGGSGLSEEEFRIFQEEIARTSGSLAFLQTQHQSAGTMLAKNAPAALKQEYLPRMSSGERGVGIGFSQLRRLGPPIMTATETDGGYFLNGNVPWVTGEGFYQEFLMGATLPNGEALFGIVPLTDQEGVRVSPPMELAAMESPRTVAVDFENYLLTTDRVGFTQPSGWIQKNDMINISLQGFFALGCARAGLDIVKAAYKKRGASFLQDAWVALDGEIVACRAKIIDQTLPESEKLLARAWVIDLAVRCAHAGVAASSGAANSIHHNAQRVYREALVYTVSAQTGPIMEATLARLSKRVL